ncbi:hypothetical protein BaRGS_00021693 [Batillaria attramentaria]|uniref:Uncharacterized protein n=1 Tax=Batillaria attramentaria TaxID=370345 RepID=A0ABD0KJ53_9CAEN
MLALLIHPLIHHFQLNVYCSTNVHDTKESVVQFQKLKVNQTEAFHGFSVRMGRPARQADKQLLSFQQKKTNNPGRRQVTAGSQVP